MKAFFAPLFMLLSITLFSQDYSASRFSPPGDTIPVCVGDSNTLVYLITDDGSNTYNTNYEVSSSSSEVTLYTAEGTTPVPMGNVSNGTAFLPLLLRYKVTDTASLSYYTIRLILTCADSECTDPADTTAYTLELTMNPVAQVEAVPDTVLCSDDPVVIIAQDTNNTPGLSYEWSTGSTSPFISVDTAGEYWVKITNGCASSSDTITIYPGGVPTIDSSVCTVTADTLRNRVYITDTSGLATTFTWLHDGDTIASGGDFTIVSTDTSSMLMVVNSDTTDYSLQIFNCVVSNYCGSASSDGCVGLLPITLVLFEADLLGQNVYINWATASEQNNEHFSIERSIDGHQFESIGIVNGAGNSTSTINYSFIDPNAMTLHAPYIYYRLKQVDFDGLYTYSEVISVEIESDQNLPFEIGYANFNDQSLLVQFNQVPDSEIDISLYDFSGRLISTQSFKVPGQRQFTMDTGDIPSGIYVLTVTKNDEIKQLKVLK